MAKKRRIEVGEVERLEPAVSDGVEGIPEKYKDTPWRVWLRKTYLKYWYVVGCAFLDVVVAMEIARTMPEGLSASVPILVLIVLVIVEVYLYIYIWRDLKLPWRR